MEEKNEPGIEMFGPARCMFGSHMPIAGLSWGLVVQRNEIGLTTPTPFCYLPGR